MVIKEHRGEKGKGGMSTFVTYMIYKLYENAIGTSTHFWNTQVVCNGLCMLSTTLKQN